MQQRINRAFHFFSQQHYQHACSVVKKALYIIIPIQIVFYLWLMYMHMPLGRDAWAYLGAARAIAIGGDPYTADFARYLPEASVAPPPYLYPPLLAILLLPLTKLPFDVAIGLWIAIVIITVLALIGLLSSLVGWRVAFIAVLGFLPTWRTVWDGQINALIAILLTLVIVDLRYTRTGRAGIWLSIGALIKIIPGFGLAMLAVRHAWRSLFVAVILSLGVILVTLPIVPLTIWYKGLFFAITNPRSAPWTNSWTIMLSNFPAPLEEFTPLLLTVIVVIILLARTPKLPLFLALAAAYLLPLLVARTVWEHHAVMILPALAILWQWNQRGRTLATVTWLAITLFGGLMMTLTLTVCWVACCWPQLLLDQPSEQIIERKAEA